MIEKQEDFQMGYKEEYAFWLEDSYFDQET